MEVLQYSVEGTKQKSGVHKQMEKLVVFCTAVLSWECGLVIERRDALIIRECLLNV